MLRITSVRESDAFIAGMIVSQGEYPCLTLTLSLQKENMYIRKKIKTDMISL